MYRKEESTTDKVSKTSLFSCRKPVSLPLLLSTFGVGLLGGACLATAFPLRDAFFNANSAVRAPLAVTEPNTPLSSQRLFSPFSMPPRADSAYAAYSDTDTENEISPTETTTESGSESITGSDSNSDVQTIHMDLPTVYTPAKPRYEDMYPARDMSDVPPPETHTVHMDLPAQYLSPQVPNVASAPGKNWMNVNSEYGTPLPNPYANGDFPQQQMAPDPNKVFGNDWFDASNVQGLPPQVPYVASSPEQSAEEGVIPPPNSPVSAHSDHESLPPGPREYADYNM